MEYSAKACLIVVPNKIVARLAQRVSFVLCAAAFALVGCGSSTKTFVGPDGQELSTVRCTSSTGQCFAKAQQVCKGKPYSVIDSYSNAGGLAADVIPGPVTWYTMTVQCGASDGKIPQFPFRGGTFGESMSAVTAATTAQAKQQSTYRRPVNCTSTRIGNTVNTNCY